MFEKIPSDTKIVCRTKEEVKREGAESLTRWSFGSVHSTPARAISDISLLPTPLKEQLTVGRYCFEPIFWKNLAEMKE